MLFTWLYSPTCTQKCTIRAWAYVHRGAEAMREHIMAQIYIRISHTVFRPYLVGCWSDMLYRFTYDLILVNDRYNPINEIQIYKIFLKKTNPEGWIVRQPSTND